MNRILGAVSGFALTLVLVGHASAQVSGETLDSDTPQVSALPVNQTHGGFGFEYTQLLPSNSYVLDRYWMAVATPSIDSQTDYANTKPPAVMSPTPVQKVQRALTARSAKPVRSSKARTRRLDQGEVQSAEPLPTGSLSWEGASGVPLYFPSERMGSYGYGYGVSSYGSINYGSSYKGYYWGY